MEGDDNNRADDAPINNRELSVNYLDNRFKKTILKDAIILLAKAKEDNDGRMPYLAARNIVAGLAKSGVTISENTLAQRVKRYLDSKRPEQVTIVRDLSSISTITPLLATTTTTTTTPETSRGGC